MTTSCNCQPSSFRPSAILRRSVDRRGALQRLGACAIGLISGIRVALAQRKLGISLDKAEMLKTAGGSAVLKIEGRDLLFIRESEDSVRVLDPTCSHRRCRVQYNQDKQRIICGCHGSNFSLEGKVLKGPAEKPLQTFEAALDESKTRIILSVE